MPDLTGTSMKKKKEKSSEKTPAAEEAAESELEMPVWSVVTFERCAASGLTYRQAAEKLKRLQTKKVSGLCIVTDEAAARMTDRKRKTL